MAGKKNKPAHYAGMEDVQAAPIVARLLLNAGADAKAVIVTASQATAAAFAKQLSFFLGQSPAPFVLPEDDPPFLRTVARSREAETARLLAMSALAPGAPNSPGADESAEGSLAAEAGAVFGAEVSAAAAVVVCPVSAAIRDVCGPGAFTSLLTTIAPGAGYSRGDLIRRLSETGYRRVPYAESRGEFAARGDIVDVFPLNSEEPYRLSYFDEEIESVRPFDPETQVSRESGGSGKPIVVVPAAESASEGLCIADWLGDDGIFICLDPARISSALKLRESEALYDFEALAEEGEAAEADWDAYRGESDWEALLERKQAFFFTPDGTLPEGEAFKGVKTIRCEARQTSALYGQLDLLSAELKSYLRKKFTVTIVCATGERLASLRQFAEQEGFSDKIVFAVGELASGIELPGEKAVWLSDSDIFKSGKKSRRQRLKGHEKIHAFTDIEKGDYIVHEKYGIGVYRGIKTIETYGSKCDYLWLAYAGKDSLYLPAWQLDRVQKYVGGGERRPRLSKLGSDDWSRTKSRVRTEIEGYATELLRLAAERKLSPGFAFSPDTVWQKDFDDRFPFEPTPDQLRCFEAVRGDMENPWPMDRLICGDVGYGKTEVALRAVFKCVQDGKQAAILVPTTILASQHFRTFTERFSEFPVRLEMLSRFITASAAANAMEGIKNGEVDIVIGTHALLSKKLSFKNLGLLVIDEEQRFGVRHKETIRGLRAGVDVLTLTATPIPRTLNMSLLGIKDMELIEDPPEDRYPVRTYVSEERPDVMAEALRRELDRGGQVYVVFNRIEGIDRAYEQLRALAPQARIGICHAKMNERMIEEIMQDFYENEFDVLLSTTIIESGLDIPNVNTILILDADRLGLTQLYQLRGRVGRTNRIAFAYLMFRKDKVLTETAEKRLRTIREFTEFGSGFKIAMKDLELRGAGNLLGTSQHGHMASVGYEMYVKLLDEAVRRIGAGIDHSLPEAESDCRVELEGTAVMPAGYIEDEVVKLQAYKRISAVRDEETKEAVLAELKDRFGSVPPGVMTLVHAAWLRHLGEAAGASEVKLAGRRADVVYRETPDRFVKKIFEASELAHKNGGTLEADIKDAPRLKLTMPQGTPGQELFNTAAAVLAVLGGR